MFATNRIDDAFAVVDVGAADVDVQFQNRPVGKTNRAGFLIVPDLKSYEPNTVSIAGSGGATASARQMLSGANALNYQLFSAQCGLGLLFLALSGTCTSICP